MKPLLFTAVALLLLSESGRGQDKVNDAIAKGARYLASHNYTSALSSNHGIGVMALAGLALMEADDKAYAPQINTFAQVIRVQSIIETGTYQTALAIIFLDRHGSPDDVGLIQILGARLMASQGIRGGWGYSCTGGIDAAEVSRIRASLVGVKANKTTLNPEAGRIVIGVAQGLRNAGAQGAEDNSNTQFATIGLWVARRNGVPVDPTLFRLQARYLRSQDPANGGWGYIEGTSSPSMTCAGLLALATAKAAAESPFLETRIATDPNDTNAGKKKDEDDPFTKPPLPGQAEADDPNAPTPPAPDVDTTVPSVRDKAIERGLAGLGLLLQAPATVSGNTQSHYGGMADLYFFWSLERVAVAFALDTIGGVDWYKWGSEAILTAQRPDGGWTSPYDEGPIGTAFALLFLKKANFTADLSRQIKNKVKDPGSGELRGGRGTSGIPDVGTPQERKPGEDPKAAKVNKVRPPTEADKVAQRLLESSDRDWPTRLATARDTRGPQNTQGIVIALGTLNGKRQYQAREALSERLVRMTTDTLKTMLSDRDAELRRAACLAVGMKDDWQALGEVVERVNDPNEIVSRAARATLKTLSNEDFGPKVGASDSEKRDAMNAWKLWYAKALRMRPNP